MYSRKYAMLIIVCAALAACGGSDSSTATEPVPPAPKPEATILLDEAHNNYHTISGRYMPFAELLRSDGWTVLPSSSSFSAAALERGRVMVVANALAPENVNRWTLPTLSAFTPAEVAAVRDWVAAGGSLLLIADHMPFPGAANQLATAFGFEMLNGFAFDTAQLARPSPCLAPGEIQIFRRSDGSLADHPVTNGRNPQERVDSIATFTGQAFRGGSTAAPILTFGARAVSLQPNTAWEFSAATPRTLVNGWQQGALKTHGNGRVALFGEAAMFTRQTCGANVPMGMNAPAAQQNARLLLNVVNWLAARS